MAVGLGRAAEDEDVELTLNVMGGPLAQWTGFALTSVVYDQYGSPRHLDSRTEHLSVSPEM
jgi:hypothetical protein